MFPFISHLRDHAYGYKIAEMTLPNTLVSLEIMEALRKTSAEQ
jgi:hypothetical protein